MVKIVCKRNLAPLLWCKVRPSIALCSSSFFGFQWLMSNLFLSIKFQKSLVISFGCSGQYCFHIRCGSRLFKISRLPVFLKSLPVPCISEGFIEIKIKFSFSHFFVVPEKVLRRPLRSLWNLLRHCKEVWKKIFLFLNFFSLSGIGTGRVKSPLTYK